jgi:anti-anti-sigma factor
MTLLLHHDSTSGTLRLEGRFTFEWQTEFRAAAQDLVVRTDQGDITLDLASVSYMDSASLGMLMLLREKAQAKGLRVVLDRPSPTVLNILNIVEFDKLFEIRPA